AADARTLPEKLDPEKGLAWRSPLPPGHSTPCVHGDSIFLTVFENKILSVVRLDRATGKMLWKRNAPTKTIEQVHPTGSPASCTPACDGERVYSFFGSFGLLCHDLDGKLIWSKPMGPFQDEFGANSSPILVGDKLILNQDHDVDNFLTALDKRTGKTIWKTSREGFTRSYSTPVAWTFEGRTQLIVAGSLQLTGYDAETGKKVWWVDGLSRILDTTPVVSGNTAYVASWTPGGDAGQRIAMEAFPQAAEKYDKNQDGGIAKDELPRGAVLTRFYRIDLNQDGKLDAEEWKKHARVFELAQNVALAVKLGGKGNVTATHVQWTQRQGLPTVPSPTVYQGVVSMIKKGGILTTLDAKTGEIIKQDRAAGLGSYYASVVAGDGKIYLADERGTVSVLKAGREWEVLSSHKFGERITATPVLQNGRVYLRTEEALYNFGTE
ncbi:MAG: PQQ-binding-like beta-propeller repeat protein, partial [Planctomycetales bacterium]